MKLVAFSFDFKIYFLNRILSFLTVVPVTLKVKKKKKQNFTSEFFQYDWHTHQNIWRPFLFLFWINRMLIMILLQRYNYSCLKCFIAFEVQRSHSHNTNCVPFLRVHEVHSMFQPILFYNIFGSSAFAPVSQHYMRKTWISLAGIFQVLEKVAAVSYSNNCITKKSKVFSYCETESYFINVFTNQINAIIPSNVFCLLQQGLDFQFVQFII